ncbi:MAG: serine/threonine-protein kinase [Candidatus Melainabacteria bacterium]|nr:serine/threonine-protein kinase [Candidatus Melainabacteria bacterium]
MKLCLICNFQTAGEQDICPRDGSSMVTVGDDPLLGMVVEGRYKIQSVIGQGSAGTVYRAVQELIGREVAVKVLHDYLVSDDEFIKRFKQEAKASSRLNHPNIITIYDFGVIPQGGGRPYIAMDLLNGTPLSDFIAEVNHIPPVEAVPIFTQVCAALAEAHRQGVVHRDIKPENIVLVERGGQKNFPIVVDFGIARLVQEESDQAKITRTGTVCGSPTYMSPEQCTSSKVDHRSDIYSLGIVFYESLTGEVPFQHDELVRVMAMHLSDTPLPLNEMRPDLNFPEALMQVVHKTLLKNPNDRYQTMDELSQALEDAMKEPEKPSVATTQTVHKDIAPGPLAQDETLQHRKESREMLQQRPLTREMLLQQNATNPASAGAGVSHAGEENRSMSSNYADQVAAYRDAQRHADVSNSQNRNSTNFSAGRGGATGAAQALRLVPIIITVLLIGAAVVFALTSAQFQAMMPWNNKSAEVKAVNDDDPEALIKAGKLAQAISLMKAQKTQGKLSPELIDKYYTTCVSLGKLYMKDKKYTEAIAVLQQVPAKSNQGQTAKNLLAKAKKQAH